MSIHNAVTAIGGAVVMLSLLLGGSISPLMVDENWLWLAAVSGLMSFQSALTGFCPAAIIAKKMGAK